MSKTYKIQRLDVLDLLVDVGYKSCVKWDEARLTSKVNELGELAEESEIGDVGADNKKLLRRILKELGAGNSFRVIYEDNDDTPKEIKEKVAKKESKHTRKPNPKGEGVIASIVSVIQQHGPITRLEILDHLSKLFPDRAVESMNTTLRNQLSLGLHRRGVSLGRNWSGDRVAYFIADGNSAGNSKKPRKTATGDRPKTSKKVTRKPKTETQTRKARVTTKTRKRRSVKAS